jgi:hypothetical protein
MPKTASAHSHQAFTSSTIAHPWASASQKAESPELVFLQKQLGLEPVQVKVLNWLKQICGEGFNYQNGKYRETASLTVVLPEPFRDQCEALLVSLGFQKQSTSPWSNEWVAHFDDEHPVATLDKHKGEIDIRKLPYKAPREQTPRKGAEDRQGEEGAALDTLPQGEG